MTQSMTAFASAEIETDIATFQCELRSVNHRYLDVSLRIPEDMRPAEQRLRELIAKKLSRGKVDVGIRFKKKQQAAAAIHIDKDYAKSLLNAISEIETLQQVSETVNPVDILRWPGVIQEAEKDNTPLIAGAQQVLEQALQDMQAARKREGDKLAELIEERLQAITKEMTAIRKHRPSVLAAQKEKLLKKLNQIDWEKDDKRVEQELVIAAQRLDVDEELDRLDTHIPEIRSALKSGKPAGRRLDFLMQELNREANTLGSKSSDASTTKSAVELKVLIEQMREQIQNLE